VNRSEILKFGYEKESRDRQEAFGVNHKKRRPIHNCPPEMVALSIAVFMLSPQNGVSM